MRIERTGTISHLPSRLRQFLVEDLRASQMDDLLDSRNRRIDFSCLNGLVAIEMKTLESDGSERMDNLLNELRKRPDWPPMFGRPPLESFLKNITDPDEVKRRVFDRIARAVREHLRKANKQLAAHSTAFPRKNCVRLVIVVNDDHEIYEPEVVARIVDQELRRTDGGRTALHNIDSVVYFTERHASPLDIAIAFPLIVIEGEGVHGAIWKREIIRAVLNRWAAWNNCSSLSKNPRDVDFSTIEHIPDRMKRYEAWELQYKRAPYMTGESDDFVRERFDEVICISSLAFVNASPFRPEPASVNASLELMSHLMLEMGWRGIAVSKFAYVPERIAAAARRLSMPEPVVHWFTTDLGRRT